MSFVHGRTTFVSLNGSDLSAFSKKSDWERSANTHDVTTFGANDEIYQGGLKKGQASVEGIYDNTAGTGPRAVINALIGSTVTFIRRPEGTGTGKPQDSVSVVVERYTETNPVDDMVSWAVDLKLAGAVTSTTQ